MEKFGRGNGGVERGGNEREEREVEEKKLREGEKMVLTGKREVRGDNGGRRER